MHDLATLKVINGETEQDATDRLIRNAIKKTGLKPNLYQKMIMEANKCDFATALAVQEYMYGMDFSEASREEIFREAKIAYRFYRGLK